MGLSQTFHVLGRCWFHISFVQLSGCTLGAFKTTGWYIVSCYLLHLRIDNIGSHLSSCQKPTQQANLERDVVLVSEHKIGLSMSHEVVQHTGEGAKGVIFNQVLFTSQNLPGWNRIKWNGKIVNLKTKVGCRLLWDPQLFNHQYRRSNLSDGKWGEDFDLYLFTLLSMVFALCLTLSSTMLFPNFNDVSTEQGLDWTDR